MQDDSDPDPDMRASLPGTILFLRRLVGVLTAVMILGVVTVVVLLVIRLQSPGGAGMSGLRGLPDMITLPEGTEATAFTVAPGWYGVVTGADEILIFDRQSGALRQRLQITTGGE